MGESKTLTAYMVVDWKHETLRTRKTEPDGADVSPYEIVIPVEVDVHVPEVDPPKLEATVEVPQVAVESGLRAEDAQHADESLWHGVADELVEDAAENGDEYDFNTVYRLTGEVLNSIEVYPDPAEVKNYVSSEYGRAVRERAD